MQPLPAAGARMLHLIFQKYVLALHWRLELDGPGGTPVITPPPSPAPGGSTPPSPSPLFEAVQVFLSSALALADQQLAVALQGEVQAIQEGGMGGTAPGLLAACRTAFAHGPLLLLRYVAAAPGALVCLVTDTVADTGTDTLTVTACLLGAVCAYL